MIAAWMLYSVLVTGLFALAAAAAERALRLASRQARLVWLGAMIAALCVVAPALLTAPPRVTRTSHEASTATPGLAGRSAATTTAAADARGRIRGGAARRGLDTGWVGRLRAGIQIPDAPSLPRLDRPMVSAWIAASLAWIAIVIA